MAGTTASTGLRDQEREYADYLASVQRNRGVVGGIGQYKPHSDALTADQYAAYAQYRGLGADALQTDALNRLNIFGPLQTFGSENRQYGQLSSDAYELDQGRYGPLGYAGEAARAALSRNTLSPQAIDAANSINAMSRGASGIGSGLAGLQGTQNQIGDLLMQQSREPFIGTAQAKFAAALEGANAQQAAARAGYGNGPLAAALAARQGGDVASGIVGEAGATQAQEMADWRSRQLGAIQAAGGAYGAGATAAEQAQGAYGTGAQMGLTAAGLGAGAQGVRQQNTLGLMGVTTDAERQRLVGAMQRESDTQDWYDRYVQMQQGQQDIGSDLLRARYGVRPGTDWDRIILGGAANAAATGLAGLASSSNRDDRNGG